MCQRPDEGKGWSVLSFKGSHSRGKTGKMGQETLTASGPIGLVAVVHGAASVYRSSQALSLRLAVIRWLDHLSILSTKEMNSSKVSGLKSHSYCMSKLEFTPGHPRLQILCFFSSSSHPL